MNNNEVIYFDNAATTKIDSLVCDKMMKVLTTEYGNPNSSHIIGKQAKELIEESRSLVAKMINCSPKSVFFTSGGTESNNWAVYSSIVTTKKRSIATSKIEHHSIHNSIKSMRKSLGAKNILINVDEDGIVDIEQIKDNLNNNIALLSIMYANNEIGTIQPIKEIAKLTKEKGVLFHTDAVQASGKINIDVEELGVDMLSISGHKFHASKGVGVLYIKPNTKIHPLISGGNQEEGFRSGTYNVPGIVSIGEAAKLVNNIDKQKEIKQLENMLWDGIKNSISTVSRNGNPEKSVPGVVNVCFHGIEAKSLVLELSQRGLCCSSGSACNEGETFPSHVLAAIGIPVYNAHSSIRFTLSKNNTKEEIQRAIPIIKEAVKNNRAINLI